MALKYKLIYFPLTGLGESIRLLFVAAGVEYEDCRVPYEEWPNVKPDMPQKTLPVLVIDGKIRLTQSNAIARYVARELCLYGKNSLEAAQINEIVDTLKDLTEAVRPSMVELDKVKKVELRKKFQTEEAPKYLAFVEKQITSYGKDGFAVSTSFSLADAQIYALFSFFIPKDLLEGFPKVQETMDKVESHTNIAKYLTERPEFLLPPQFRDEPTEDVWFQTT